MLARSGNVLPVHLAIAAGALRAAFNNVSGNVAGSQLVPIVRPPAEAVDHGREHQGGIGATAGDDHVRAGGQSFGQRKRADVSIGAEDARREWWRWARRYRCCASRGPLPRNSSMRPSTSSPSTTATFNQGRALNTARAQANGFTPPALATTLIPRSADACCDASNQRREVARIAEFGVGLPLLLQDGHGDFGQIIEREIIDGPVFHQAHGGFQPVAPEALTISDSNHRLERSARSQVLRRCRDVRSQASFERGPEYHAGVLSSGSMMASNGRAPRRSAHPASARNPLGFSRCALKILRNRFPSDFNFSSSAEKSACTAESPSITPMRAVGQLNVKFGSKPCPAMA